MLKVTPAHDKADFEIGQRHKLPVIDIMNPNGTMNDLAGRNSTGWIVSPRARWRWRCCRELGAAGEGRAYENNVGFSERADVPIEPRLSEQWFLKYPSVEEAQRCGRRDGRDAVFIPSAGRRFTTTGWRTFRTGASAASSGGGIGFRCGIDKTRPGASCLRASSRRRMPENWTQDPDVLDTWFSSLALAVRDDGLAEQTRR